MVTLKNVSENDIVDYPIAEPALVNGEVRYDTNNNIISTGKTLLWTINSGETKAFPEYVSKVLMARYGVEDPQTKGIKSVLEEVETKEVVEEQVPENGCKHCGKVFKNKRALGLHMGLKHPDEL